jgi:hypothetical protein
MIFLMIISHIILIGLLFIRLFTLIIDSFIRLAEYFITAYIIDEIDFLPASKLL